MTRPRIVLVTGGGTGAGKAIARRFAEEGATVYVAGRRAAMLEQTAAEFKSLKGRVTAIPSDVSNAAQVEALIDRIHREEGCIDVLVNAANVFGLGLLDESTEEQFDSIFASNVRGTWLVSKTAVPMLRRSRNPNIINISSTAGERTDPGMGLYEASKAAVNTLTKVMAQELSRYKIRVNAIAPGPVNTELYTGSILGDDVESHLQKVEEPRQMVPFGRTGTPEEVARLAIFLASPESDFITGSITSIDGAMGY